MIWFFIPLLIGTGFILFRIYDDIFPHPTIGEIFNSICLFIFCEFLAIIFSIAIYIGCGSIVGLFFEPVSYTQTETPLIALKDNSTIDGSFFSAAFITASSYASSTFIKLNDTSSVNTAQSISLTSTGFPYFRNTLFARAYVYCA